MFRKLAFDTIFYVYLIESPFKYYISILLGVGGRRPCLFCLFFLAWGGPEFGETCLYNTCTLPKAISTQVEVEVGVALGNTNDKLFEFGSL